LWLKADSGVVTDVNGSIITWHDQRTGSTNVASPYPAPDPPDPCYPHPPKLATFVTAGGRTFPVVRIDARIGIGGFLTIPNDGSASFVIPGDLSLIVVYDPNGQDPNSYHSVVALRGPEGIMYEMFLSQSYIRSDFWNGGSAFQMLSSYTRKAKTNTWHITHIRISGTALSFLDAETQEYKRPLEDIGDGVVDSLARATTMFSPLGIGMHTQNPKVDIHPYRGDIAEILLYKTALSDAQAKTVTDYIYEKYFVPNKCGDLGTYYLTNDVSKDCRVDMADLPLVIQDWLMCTDPVSQNCK